MQLKKNISISAVMVGVALIGFGIIVKTKTLHANEKIEQLSEFTPSTLIALEHTIHSKLSKYDILIRWALISGVVITLVGAAGIYASIRSKKH